MHRIPELVELPDQIERLAQELEQIPLNERPVRAINELRARAFAIACDLETHRTLMMQRTRR